VPLRPGVPTPVSPVVKLTQARGSRSPCEQSMNPPGSAFGAGRGEGGGLRCARCSGTIRSRALHSGLISSANLWGSMVFAAVMTEAGGRFRAAMFALRAVASRRRSLSLMLDGAI
jgi:hypothetical protein